MSTLSIVKHFDVIEDIGASQLASFVDPYSDGGLISFLDDESLVISERLAGKTDAAGISPAAKLRNVASRHRNYLRYHRQEILG